MNDIYIYYNLTARSAGWYSFWPSLTSTSMRLGSFGSGLPRHTNLRKNSVCVYAAGSIVFRSWTLWSLNSTCGGKSALSTLPFVNAIL